MARERFSRWKSLARSGRRRVKRHSSFFVVGKPFRVKWSRACERRFVSHDGPAAGAVSSNFANFVMSIDLSAMIVRCCCC